MDVIATLFTVSKGMDILILILQRIIAQFQFHIV